MPSRLPYPYFQIRRHQENGDRLVWRLPFNDPKVRAQLDAALAPEQAPPKQITLGYYRRTGGRWSFVALDQPLSAAAMEIDGVRRRIKQDLANYHAQLSPHTDTK